MAESFSIAASLLAAVGFVTAAADFVRQRRSPRKSGLTIRQNPEHAEVDIVFVHGLGTDSESAWSDTDPATGQTLCWPRTELVPPRLSVQARVTTYDYDSKFRTPEYLTRRTLLHQTGRLIEDIAQLREDHRSRLPIVFVCHSLGGIIVKNALARARNSEDPRLLDVFDAVSGIIFLGTPHGGSPDALAGSISRIVKMVNPEVKQELRDRTRTLAYSLERFKPLAAHLVIHAFNEAGPARVPFLDNHIHPVNRDHAHLAKFTNPNDNDLTEIIRAIDNICMQSKEKSTTEADFREGLSGKMAAVRNDEVLNLSIENDIASSVRTLAKTQAELKNLERFFARWSKKRVKRPFYLSPQDAWPVAVLSGDPGCGKTETSLDYVREYRGYYGSLIWINASTRKSMELSFRNVDRKIHAQQHQGRGISEGTRQHDNGSSNDEEIHVVVQRVTEWLERPQQKKWLLIFDNLSCDSPYPILPPWTSKLSKRHTWRELLRLIPTVTGWHGHVIICTRENPKVGGLKVIRFKKSDSLEETCQTPPASTSGEFPVLGSGPVYTDPLSQIAAWWRDLSVRHTQLQFSLALIMSDKTCPRIPLSLLDDEDIADWPIDDLVIIEDHAMHYLVLPAYLLRERSPILVHNAPYSRASVVQAAAVQACTRLSEAIVSRRGQSDPVFSWDIEAQVVRNIAATLANWHELQLSDIEPAISGKRLLEDIADMDCIKWAEMARVCEDHSAYDTAAKLYELERRRQPKNTRRHTELRLDYIRVSHQAQPSNKEEADCQDIISDPKVPLDLRIDASREFASWRASQGQYEEAVNQLSKALALEDPFGANANEHYVTESIGDLAAYLVKIGDRSSAGALLQRMILSLEDTHGRGHLSTLSTMEALSVIKQEEGELQEACSLLNIVHDYQQKRLGDEHPSTVLGWSKVAAVLDLEGHQQKAEPIYQKCLNRATESLGPHHPSVFGIRENLARCLLAQGKTSKARKEFKALQEEIEIYPGMYSNAVARRTFHFLDGSGTVDDYELDLQLSRRNTLGVEDLEDDYDDMESDDNRDEQPEYWDMDMDDEEE